MPNLDDENYETVIGVDGKPTRILKDGARVRVSMLDAMAARHQLSDAEQYAMRDAEWRRSQAGNRPGFRFLNTDEASQARQRVRDAYLQRDAEQASAWENNPPTGAGENQFRGSQPGQKCTIDGRAGHLQMMDGELVCIPDEELADAMHDELESAYASYRDHLENSYKKLR